LTIRYLLKGLSHKGFSLVEILVASAVLIVSSLGVVFLIQQKSVVSNISDSSSCVAHLNKVMTRLKEKGLRLEAHDFLPTDTALRPVAASAPSQNGILNVDRWPDHPDYSISTNVPVPELRNSHLLLSSVSAIAAIYNSSASYCSNATGVAYNTADLMANSRSRGVGATAVSTIANTRIRIQPYQLDTNDFPTPACPAGPLIIKPTAQAEVASGFTTSPLPVFGPPAAAPYTLAGPDRYFATMAANVEDNLGFLVTVFAEYQKNDGNTAPCTLQQRFQYQRDGTPATFGGGGASSQATGASNMTAIGPQNCEFEASANVNLDVVVEFGEINGNVISEDGSIMLCRDLSYKLEPEDGNYNCYSGISSKRQYEFPGTEGGKAITTATAVDTYYFDGRGIPKPDPLSVKTLVGDGFWKPCDQIVACGLEVNADFTGGNLVYTLNYNSLVWNCIIRIQYTIIDPAGNATPPIEVVDTSGNTESKGCGVYCAVPNPGLFGGAPYYSCFTRNSHKRWKDTVDGISTDYCLNNAGPDTPTEADCPGDNTNAEGGSIESKPPEPGTTVDYEPLIDFSPRTAPRDFNTTSSGIGSLNPEPPPDAAGKNDYLPSGFNAATNWGAGYICVPPWVTDFTNGE